MKITKLLLFAIAFVCGTSVFTSCSKDDNPAEHEQGGKKRQEFLTHTKANLKEMAENMNFESMKFASTINLKFNKYVLNNPEFEAQVLPLFRQKARESMKPVEPGSELANMGYENQATIDLTEFNYRFTMKDDNSGFDVEEAEDFEMIVNAWNPETQQMENGALKLVLKAGGSSFKQLIPSLNDPSLASVAIVPTDFAFAISVNRAGSWVTLFSGTFKNDVKLLGTSEYFDRKTDAYNVSGTLNSSLPAVEQLGLPGDATTTHFAIGRDPSVKKGGMIFSFSHNGKKMLDAKTVFTDYTNYIDVSQIATGGSLFDIFAALMSGSSLDEGSLTLLDDLTTNMKISDCQKAMLIRNEMISARRNYADQQTIEGYVKQLNGLISGSMSCKDLNQTIPMQLQTVKIGVDFHSVPALKFADEESYVPITELIDQESIAYGINIVDHAIEPMQQAIIVVRQLLQFIESTISNVRNVRPHNGSIAMIVKEGQIEYFQQIEDAFREACRDNDMMGDYFSTTTEYTYQEQIAAVRKLANRPNNDLKGIIYAPCKGLNGETADAEVAALAKQLNIPVIIIDARVDADSPLASCPFIGTDAVAAGQLLAEKVTEPKVAAFALLNTPGVERAQSFKEQKSDSQIFVTTRDDARSDVETAFNDYDSFVFFNGSALEPAFDLFKESNKAVYTIDVYETFLQDLLTGGNVIKGIFAQNTFEMGKKAVEAVINNSTTDELIAPIYITKDNLTDDAVLPFLSFYQRKIQRPEPRP